MSIGKFRSGLYKLSRALGDANAVKRGTVGKRVGRRITRPQVCSAWPTRLLSPPQPHPRHMYILCRVCACAGMTDLTWVEAAQATVSVGG